MQYCASEVRHWGRRWTLGAQTDLDPDTRQGLLAAVRRWSAERSDLAAQVETCKRRIEAINEDMAHALRLLRMEEAAITADGQETGADGEEAEEPGNTVSDALPRPETNGHGDNLVETVRSLLTQHPNWGYMDVKTYLDYNAHLLDKKPNSNRVWIAYTRLTGNGKVGRPRKGETGKV